jgi:hypothetical protein
MGHAFRLGHANFESDLMSQRLGSKEMMNISQYGVITLINRIFK